LIQASEASEGLSDDELTATVMLILAALFGSTVDMVGNLVSTLARNPEQYQHIRGTPASIPAAVEELFRYESPFQLIYRLATTELTIGGQEIAAGTRIALMLGAANRDPARFTDPDAFLVERAPAKHVAFGANLHQCVGIAYSRAWLRAVLTALADRLPRIRPAGPFPARPARAFRGYATVPVSW
jgi:cytochrome P450